MSLKTQQEYLSEIFKKVAEKHDVEQKYVEDMYDHFFRTTKQIIKNPQIVNIVIPKWGSFTASLRKVNYEIRKLIRQYNCGSLSREHVCVKISYLWPIRRKLMQEEIFRKKNDRRYGKRK